MIKESQFQAKLLRALKAELSNRNAIIYKHSDRFHAGIPDFSVSIGYRTLWFECKMYRNLPPTKIQQYYLDKHGDAAAVITCHDNGQEMMISPLEAVRGWITFDELVTEILSRVIV